MAEPQLKPGQRVRIIQEIDRREGSWRHEVVGVIVQVKPEPTGSWFVHGKNRKLWLQRIRLQKDSGELTTLVVDQHTRCEILEPVS